MLKNPSFMAEVFVTRDVPHGLRGGNNLVLPRARTTLYMVLILLDVLVKNYGRLCQKKSKSPNH